MRDTFHEDYRREYNALMNEANMYKYDIYAAGPFFNPEQRATMDAAIKGLREAGFTVCDPRDLNPVLVDMTPEQRKLVARRIYEDNIEAIEYSYLVVACIDDRDPGTAFEIGYTVGTMSERNAGFVTFSGFGHGCNVMLSQPAEHHWPYVADMIEGIKKAKSLIDRREVIMEEFARLWGSERVKAEAVE
jgi:nucleoside 2-deoxyribosyltransferase